MVKFYPILAICNAAAIAVQYVFNALASSGPDGTIFLNKTGDLSDKYYTEITPAGWTFSIWGFIYAWQVTWVIYSLVNICRKGATGRPAYDDPQFLPNSLFLISIAIAAANIGWLISFDRQEIELAAAMLIAYSLMQYSLMFVVYRSLDKSSPKLAQQCRSVDIWLTRGTVLNGVAMQATWVTIATLLNINMVLVYSGDQLVSVEDAATIVLSVLTVIISVFAVSDLFFLDRYSRYTITPYIVLVLALSGSISKNWNSEKRNSIFTAVLLAVSSLMLATKLVVTIYRHFTKPRYTTVTYESKNEMKSKDTDKFEP